MNEQVIRLGGGIDTATSPMGANPGGLLGCENYEPKLEGGYQRAQGTERFDGRTKPSEGTFVVLGSAGWTAGAVVGATLVGATSGASGTIAWRSGTLTAVAKVTGSYQAGENVTVSAVVVGTAIAIEPATTGAQENAIHAAVAAIYRADIDEVPGSGPVRGVCVIDGDVFAFRDNAGGTKQEVWKASPAGWVAIDYPNAYMVGFTVGNGSYDGLGSVTVTQGANSAIVHKVLVESGSFADGDAKGVLLLRSQASPGALGAGAATFSSGLGTLTLQTGHNIVYQAVTLAPGGRWRFRPYRFALAGNGGLLTGPTPLYGVDWLESGGGGNLIEFDGTIVAPINWTTFGLDPEQIECHKNHLFISTRGVLRISALGTPYGFSALEGAGEVVIGDRVTAMVSVQGSEDQSALLVCCADRSQVIYGNTTADFKMVPLSAEVGAKPYSMQQLAGATLAFDHHGVRDFRPTQAFGNFAFGTLTNHLRNKVVGKTPTASVVDRVGGRYRVYFDDGTWLSGLPGKRWSWTLGSYPWTVSNASEWEIDGASVIFLCGEDGYVRQGDSGRSFDGEPIVAWLKTAYAHFGAPTMRKAFRGMSIEVRSRTVGTISMQPDYSYGKQAITESAMAAHANEPVQGSDAAFDLGGTWSEGTWDAAYMTELYMRSPGIGENVSTLLYSSTDGELPVEVTAITHFYLPRRKKRGRA